MRKESKTTVTVTLETVQSYHAGSYNGNYAFQGFVRRLYFKSDRVLPLDAKFQLADGTPLKGYGLEIETECNGINENIIYAEILKKIVLPHFLNGEELFKLQNDSTLHGYSNAECITQVMTKAYIRNNYPAWKLMYDTYFPALKVSCSQTGNCGMHVNMSNGLFGATAKTQETAIKKLLYIVNRHYNLVCALTNRSLNHTHWCGRMPQYATMEGAKNANLNAMPGSHGNCFNGSHYPEGRIELRIVGGQANFPCFRNTMESIFHLVDAVKRLSWADCDDVTEIFAGCNQYVYDRLRSKCKQAGTITDEQLTAILPTVKREELL